MRWGIHIRVSYDDVMSVEVKQFPYEVGDFCFIIETSLSESFELKLGRYITGGDCFTDLPILMTSFSWRFDGKELSI